MALLLGEKRAATLLAPVAGKRVRGLADARLAPPSTGVIDLLPPELLEKIVHSCSGILELCVLAGVCKRLREFADSEALWQGYYGERWAITPLTLAAVRLAGSWKRLFASKQVTDQANLPNEKPCPYEKEAAIAQLGLSSNLQSADALTLLFLVDGSGSVSADDFQEMKAFMAEAAANTSRTVKELQVGILQFSSHVKVELGLASFCEADFSQALEKMVPINGGTEYAVAICKAGLLLRAAETSTHVSLVLLTDGRVDQFQGVDAAKAVESMQEKCSCSIALFAFGIGRSIDATELHKLVDICQPRSAGLRYLTLYGKDDGYPFEGL